jgi:hypothetical protein
VPEIAGLRVLTRAAGSGVTGRLVAGAEDWPLLATTTQVSRWPTSAETIVYVSPVSPVISAPSRFHCLEKLVGLFSQVPSEQVSSLPCCGMPPISGGSTLKGGTPPGIGITGRLAASVEDPAALVAVTRQVSACVTSAVWIV